MISLGVGLAETILCRAQKISEGKLEEWFFLGPSVLMGGKRQAETGAEEIRDWRNGSSLGPIQTKPVKRCKDDTLRPTTPF